MAEHAHLGGGGVYICISIHTYLCIYIYIYIIYIYRRRARRRRTLERTGRDAAFPEGRTHAPEEINTVRGWVNPHRERSEAVLGVWLPAPLPTSRAPPDRGALAVGVKKELGGLDV